MMTVLLHGFWGQPQDWNKVLEELPLDSSILIPDLDLNPKLSAQIPLLEWGHSFWHWVESQHGPGPIQMVGYSMGGRLALHAYLTRPVQVTRLLLLSTRPLLPAWEHAARAAWELAWAKRFQTLEWSELGRLWQEEAVFARSCTLPRRQSPELRTSLPEALLNWSPRHQRLTAEVAGRLPKAVDWAFGALDKKYVEFSKTLQEQPVQGQISILDQLGHRLITEAAPFVSQWIQTKGTL